jgi:hypothetical protein
VLHPRGEHPLKEAARMPDSAGSMSAENIATLSVRYTLSLMDRGDCHLDHSAFCALLGAGK